MVVLLCVLAYNLAVYALPFFVGLAAAQFAYETGAGLIGALTLLPGGLGSTEASTVGLLALQGVGLVEAMPATLLTRLMTLWFATAIGVVCLLWQPRRQP